MNASSGISACTVTTPSSAELRSKPSSPGFGCRLAGNAHCVVSATCEVPMKSQARARRPHRAWYANRSRLARTRHNAATTPRWRPADAYASACRSSAVYLALAAVARAGAADAGRARRLRGLFAAAATGDVRAACRALRRTPASTRATATAARRCIVAAYAGQHEAMRALVKAGANPNALEHDRYDIVTDRRGRERPADAQGRAVARRERRERHQPLRRHGADRRRAPRARGHRARADPRRRAARPREQPRLDGADRVDRARRRRSATRRHAARARRRRRERQPRRSRRRDAARARSRPRLSRDGRRSSSVRARDDAVASERASHALCTTGSTARA